MSTLHISFRYDFVGSFLRPQKLKEAKQAYTDGKITKEELDTVIDDAVRDVVAKQKSLGYHVIQMENSGELSGIWILCGDLKA